MSNSTSNNHIEDEAMTETTDQIEEQVPENIVDMQTETPAEAESLTAEIERLKQEAQTNLDGWQRSRAEFANYKRRTSQELSDSRQNGAIEALTKMLPILDDFERALDNIPDELGDHAWISGIALILKNFQKVLDEYNVTVIDPVGEEFNPNWHEAVGTEDSDEYDSGIVTVTLQKGYRSAERVLRPALVRVAT